MNRYFNRLSLTLAIFFSVVVATVNCGIKTDKEFMNQLEEIEENCELGDKSKHGWKIENCKNNEVETAKKYIKEKGVPNILPTLVVAFSGNNDNLAIISTYFLNWNVGSSIEFQNISKNPELVDKKVAKKFIEGFEKRKEEQYARYAIRAMANLAMIQGLNQEYWKLVDSLPAGDLGTGNFYSAAITYGRLSVLDRIKDRAKNGKPFDQLQMISSSGVLYDLTDNEAKQFCPWWGDYIGVENKSTSRSAVRNIMFKCSGDLIDKALDEVESRIKNQPVADVKDYRYSLNFSSCDSKRLTEPQCKRADSLKTKLEKMK